MDALTVRDVLNEIDRLRAELAKMETLREALREIDSYSCYGTAWNAYVDIKRIAHEALAAQESGDDGGLTRG